MELGSQRLADIFVDLDPPRVVDDRGVTGLVVNTQPSSRKT